MAVKWTQVKEWLFTVHSSFSDAFLVQDSGSGGQIVEWNVVGISQPTQQDLAPFTNSDNWWATVGQRELAKLQLNSTIAARGLLLSLVDQFNEIRQQLMLPNIGSIDIIQGAEAHIDAGNAD